MPFVAAAMSATLKSRATTSARPIIGSGIAESVPVAST